MSRRRKGRNVHGIVLLDKPAGYTSSQAVQKVRWLFQARKSGHTGSLDPFATGMLPVCLGEACKTAGFMLDASKTYVARAVLGQSTTTGDTEGDPAGEAPVPELSDAEIEAVFNQFVGETEQVPPMYSALKHEGQPLYRLARAGKEVDRPSRRIVIHSLELLKWERPDLVFRAHCSKGTYIRTLAEDIALKLGSRAHLGALRRLSVEPFREQDMVGLEELVELAEKHRLDRCLLPADAGLDDWPVLNLGQADAARFSHGNPVPEADGSSGLVRVRGPDGQLLGLGQVDSDNVLKIKRIMKLQPES